MSRIVDNKFFKTILPNIVIIISCMMITLLILDYYNPLMGFLARGMSIGVIVAWIVSIVLYTLALVMRIIVKGKLRKNKVV